MSGNNSVRETSKLLLVDDEPSIVDAGSLMLEGEGYGVAAAGDSSQVMALIDDGFSPDLVICDYRLPGMNGIELVMRLRSRLGFDVPVLMMTGDTSLTATRVAGLSHCEWLRKPFEPDVLIERVAYWLDRVTG